MKAPVTPVWNAITDDIDSRDFSRRCGEFERGLLPPDVMFPRPGQIWVVSRDCQASGPLRSGINGSFVTSSVLLHRGERVRILPLNERAPLHIRFERVTTESQGESCEAPGQFSMPLANTVLSNHAMTFTECFQLAAGVS